MAEKDMTVQEYAALRDIQPSAVRKAILKGHRLPGVVRRTKFGRAHVLTVDKRKIPKSLQVTK